MTIPTSKSFLIWLSATLLIAMQSDALAYSLENGLKACAAVTNDDDRLRCFDALAAETEGSTAAPAAAAVTAPAVATAPPAAAEAPVATAPPAAAEAPAATAPPAAAEAPVAATSQVPPAPPAEPVAATAPEPISDDIGLSGIKDTEKSEPTKYSARVTSCRESKQSGQYYFYFENGQVWKQANYQRLRWRECEFDVTVSKGMFGYDMHIPEKDRTVRVSRIR